MNKKNRIMLKKEKNMIKYEKKINIIYDNKEILI